jgi:vacuolar-type H+-ATPase catalytic subunit A/Vma1
MKPYEKFLHDRVGLRHLLEIYLELRQHFQEIGFSESDLEKPPTYTEKMMRLFHKFGDTQKALFQQVNDYGFDVGWNEFIEFMSPLLQKINEITPLSKNGYSKRDDSGDEDY